MVGKLGNLEEVGGRPRHDFPRAVRVVETEGQALKAVEHVAPHVLLNPVAEDVAPVVHEPVAQPAQAEAREEGCHEDEEEPQVAVRDERVERIAREHRERHVNRGDEHGAQHVRCEQRKVRPVIGEENGERPSHVVHGTSVAEKRARGEMRREDNDRAAVTAM